MDLNLKRFLAYYGKIILMPEILMGSNSCTSFFCLCLKNFAIGHLIKAKFGFEFLRSIYLFHLIKEEFFCLLRWILGSYFEINFNSICLFVIFHDLYKEKKYKEKKNNPPLPLSLSLPLPLTLT